MNVDQPMPLWGAGINFVAWTPNVYGVTPLNDSIMLFDKAFLKN